MSSDDESEDDSDKENVGKSQNHVKFQDQLDDLIDKFQQQWWDLTSGNKICVDLAYYLETETVDPHEKLLDWVKTERIKLIPADGISIMPIFI